MRICAQLRPLVKDFDRPNKHQNVFLCPPEVTHSLIVNMQDGDSSQTERCWTEESPGDHLHIIFRNFKTIYYRILNTFTCFRKVSPNVVSTIFANRNISALSKITVVLPYSTVMISNALAYSNFLVCPNTFSGHCTLQICDIVIECICIQLSAQ